MNQTQIDRAKVDLYNRFYEKNKELYKNDRIEFFRQQRRFVQDCLEKKVDNFKNNGN